MNGLHFGFPIYFILISIFLGFLLTYFLYRHYFNSNFIKPSVIKLLFGLRWITFTCLFFLLLEPVIFSTEKIFEKPILVFAQDNSESILETKDSSFYLTTYRDSVTNWVNQLKPHYDVRLIKYGDKVQNDNKFNFKAKSTNFEQLYKSLENQFYNSNFTDLIIASDGLVNLGKQIRFLNLPFNITVNSLLLGDTIAYPDLLIKSINHNKYSLFENKFPIEVVFESNIKCKNVTINLFRKNIQVQKKVLPNVGKGITKVNFLETASEIGLCDYRVEIKSERKENNIANNFKLSTVEVIDYSQKILFLASAPHPDIAALNSVLKDLLKSKTTTFLINDFKESLLNYDLVILHKPFISQKMTKILKSVKENGIPALVFTGQNLDLRHELLYLTGMKKNYFKGSTKSQAKLNNDFKFFNSDNEWSSVISNYPPLEIPFSTEYSLINNSNILFFQSLNGVKMPFPLIYFFQNNNNNVKYATILGEGIWRWKMYEFQKFNNSKVFNQLFKKLIQSLKIIEKKERLTIKIPKKNNEDESLRIYAEFYNSSFELLSGANIKFEFIDSLGNRYSKKLIKANNGYEIDIYNLKKGTYQYSLTAEHKNEKFFKRGSFEIISSNREKFNTVANINNLKLISSNENVYQLENISQLIKDLKTNSNKKNRYHSEESNKDIIHYWWALFIIVFFPFLEWLIRKSNGLV